MNINFNIESLVNKEIDGDIKLFAYKRKHTPAMYLNKGHKCSFPGCNNEARALGYCSGHYLQQRRGIELKPLREKNKGEK